MISRAGWRPRPRRPLPPRGRPALGPGAARALRRSSIVRESALAQDLAQITFAKLWHALPQFDGRAALSTWLYAIARNTCLSALRTRRRSPARYGFAVGRSFVLGARTSDEP